ncbi:MAG: CPBP family intramembrane metalloprotease [Lachnospiraceae bacterium]|nr:CPBP family intramembrane metalloprotease [Lachnospiraceae bacterium]
MEILERMERNLKLIKKFGLASKIWDIAYPVLMYYAAISIGIICAQLVFGVSNESYMLCKTIGSVVALLYVYTEYKHDLMLRGEYGIKPQFSLGRFVNLVAVIGITVCLSIALNNLISMSPLIDMSEEFQNASDAFYGSNIWMELLGSALVTPLLEELLHRGVVYKRLRLMMGFAPSVLVSALIFAALHFNIVQFTYAFLLGIALAIFVEKTGKVYPAVIAHMVANGIAVIRTETGFLMGTVDKSAFAWTISVILCVVGVIGLVLYGMSINRKRDKR